MRFVFLWCLLAVAMALISDSIWPLLWVPLVFFTSLRALQAIQQNHKRGERVNRSRR
jgi:hypothetical protein